jgi:hypothetical protein
MSLIEHREPMIRAVRAALDRHEYEHANNDGRALAAVLAVEPLIANQLAGAVSRAEQLDIALMDIIRMTEDQGVIGCARRARAGLPPYTPRGQ